MTTSSVSAKSRQARTQVRLALNVEEACAALGVSWDFWAEYIAPEVRVVRRGRRKLVAVRELERWLERNGENRARAKARVMADEGIEVRHEKSAGSLRHRVRSSGRRPLQLRADVPRERLERARRQARPQVVPVPRRREGLAPGRRPAPSAAASCAPPPRRSSTTRSRSCSRRWTRAPSARGAAGHSSPPPARATEQTYRLRVADRYGRVRLDQLDHLELQEFIDELDAAGMNPSTIEGAILPLRLVFRWARARGIVSVDPTDGLELPEKSSRQRVPPSPQDAARLLAAVPDDDRAVWATAMLAGTRRGELLALDWPNVDLKARRPPRQAQLRPDLRHLRPPQVQARHPHHPDHRGAHAVPPRPRPPLRPPHRPRLRPDRHPPARLPPPPGPRRRGLAGPGLTRVTLHACRHLYASMSIAAGVNAHALCRYMGHSSIAVTFDLYGHLFPGNESEAAALLDAYWVAFSCRPTAGWARCDSRTENASARARLLERGYRSPGSDRLVLDVGFELGAASEPVRRCARGDEPGPAQAFKRRLTGLLERFERSWGPCPIREGTRAESEAGVGNDDAIWSTTASSSQARA